MANQDTLKWVSCWGNAMSISENRPESIGRNITFSYEIPLSFSADQFRITFDNFCGTETVTINKSSFLYKNQFYCITFQGQNEVNINAGESVTSDAIDCKIDANTQATVRFYCGSYTQLRSSVYTMGPLCEGSYACGDFTEEKVLPLSLSKPTGNVYFLSNVSLHTQQQNRSIVCFGDSITAQAWPDYLSLRCNENGFHKTSIIRRAASGSRLLRQYDCITYESYGLSGHNRFAHEVLTDGADTVIIQQGINDIIHPVGTDINPFRPMSDLPTVEEMTKEIEFYVQHAHSLGYKVYLGTLLPIEGWRTYAPFREELRLAFNDWIRTTTCADGFIDFDKAVRDLHNPHKFAPGFDSGDHLHPSLHGYQAMAMAVPETILK